MLYVLAWFFTAKAGAWENLRRVRELQGIESATHTLHRFQIGLAEHLGHNFLFVFTHTVLAGYRAACLDTEFHDAIGKSCRRFRLSRDTFVVQDRSEERREERCRS